MTSHLCNIILSCRSSFWRLSYRITSNNVTVSPAQESTVSTDILHKNLNVTRTGSGMNYGNLITPMVSAAFAYKDLFSLHITQRVAILDYVKVESKLTHLWQKSLGIAF